VKRISGVTAPLIALTLSYAAPAHGVGRWPTPRPIHQAYGYRFKSLDAGGAGVCGLTVGLRAVCWGGVGNHKSRLWTDDCPSRTVSVGWLGRLRHPA